jgi:3-hydroxyacyl-CoA dehydrogenase
LRRGTRFPFRSLTSNRPLGLEFGFRNIHMSNLVRYTKRGAIAVATIDNPPVNAMSPGVPEGILDAVRQAQQDPDVRALVLIGAGKTFIAGADIKEFGKTEGRRAAGQLASLLAEMENSTKPVIAAIHGTALGGGLETAMAAHYRIMASNASVGQPEVKIGLIPGAGGTQRLPRLAGIEKAVEMCAFGGAVNAKDALAAGIVARVVDTKGEADLLDAATEYAQEVAALPVIRTRDRNEKLSSLHSGVFDAARDQAHKKMRGQQAPLAAIDAVEASAKLSFEEGMQLEAKLFEERRASTQSKALIHAFFGERAVSKIPGIAADIKPLPVERVAILGAGTMGGGIAMSFSDAGMSVILKDTKQEALDRGLATIRSNYARMVKSGRISQEVADQRIARIKPQTSYDGFEQADLIIEAVFEDMALKKRIFGELDQVAKPSAILATNTSSLDVDEIAAATKRPEMVLGVHFFSPANIMRLVEIVRAKATRRDLLVTGMALTKKLGKIGVLAGNCYGFIGNRLMHPYVREAQFLVEEGASVEDVNAALFDFGMAMGPLAMQDQVGLDVIWLIRQAGAHRNKPGVRTPVVLEQLYNLGQFGQKTGRGWSKYDENRKPSPDAETADLIARLAKDAGIERRTITKKEIVDRCILALVNEGARILEEGVALRAVDIDIVYLNGYGFPSWRGGPMFYADTVGLPNVLRRIEEFQARLGADLWQPAPLLRQLAEEGKSFQSRD